MTSSFTKKCMYILHITVRVSVVYLHYSQKDKSTSEVAMDACTCVTIGMWYDERIHELNCSPHSK